MANRPKLVQQRHHLVAAPLKNKNFHSIKAPIFILALLFSCLISVNCISLESRSANQQQQQWSPKSFGVIYSSRVNDDDELTDLLDINQPNQASSSSIYDSESKQELDNHLLQQIAYQLNEQLHATNTQPPNSQQQQLSFEDYTILSDPASYLLRDTSRSQKPFAADINTVDNLLAVDKSPRERLINDNNDDDYAKAAAPSYFLPSSDHSRKLASSDGEDHDTTLSFGLYRQQQQQPIDYGGEKIKQDYAAINQGGQARDAYQVDGNDAGPGKYAGSNRQERDGKQRRNFTTLLEGENIDVTTEASATTTVTQNYDTQTTTSSPLTMTTIASFGALLTEDHSPSPTGSKKIGGHLSSLSSMFSEMYKNMAAYLPNFFHKSSSETGNGVDKEISQSDINLTIENSKKRVAGERDEELHNLETTKPSVVVVREMIGAKLDDDNNNDSGKNNNNNDKHEDRKKAIVNNLSENKDNNNNDDLDSNGIFKDSSLRENDLKVSYALDGNQEESKIVFRHQPSHHNNRVSLMRQSSLDLPIKSSDELVVHHTTSSSQHPESLLGKYIYAPQHHYHLNAGSLSRNGAGEDTADDSHMLTKMSPRSYTSHLNDDTFYANRFNSFRAPMYAPLHGIVEPISDKTNDLYFLVMVGAFCVMAMAVVMAAGLFAYRVQQNRKSNAETEYPTYGVVGPNNMNGKCNAGSFVGGYFSGGGGTGGPGSSVSSSGSLKKGNTPKHLADLYNNNNSDSGIHTTGGSVGNSPVGGKSLGSKRMSSEFVDGAGNQLGRSNGGGSLANQNAARMYHYQHQKQQMISSDHVSTGRQASASDLDSEDENDGGYTVYECPGLASAHEMEIKNPLFNDDRSP